MKNIWSYLSYNKKETIIAPIFKMLEACFELFIPLLVADIIDIGIAGGDTSYIVHRGILMICFGAAGFSLTLISQYFSAKSAVGVSSALRKDLFYHISSLNYEALDDVGTASLITSMTSDINQVQTGVNWTLRLFLRAPFIVFGAAFMAFRINAHASLIFWVTIALLTLVIALIIKITTPMNIAVQSKTENVTRSFRENLLGIRVIRAFNRQSSESDQFEDRHEQLYKRQVHTVRISSLLNPLTFSIINLAIVVILYTGAVNVSIGSMTQGQVIALYNYMSQILAELIKLANVILMLSKAIACFKRIQSLLKIRPTLKNGSLALDTSNGVDIDLKNVSFSYNKSGTPALDNVTVHIPCGARVGIIGATASGKTTFVNLITRFYERTGGEILLNNIPIEKYDNASLRENIAVVPQKAVLFKGSIRSNLQWGRRDATDEECIHALDNASALDFVLEKQEGLDLNVQQNGRNFSGGQRQRLSIARALMRRCSVLILDDSYSALDYSTEARINTAIAHDKTDCTVFTVSQRISSIYDSDFILVLDKGQLVDVGGHSELFERSDVYNEICRSQHFGAANKGVYL